MHVCQCVGQIARMSEGKRENKGGGECTCMARYRVPLVSDVALMLLSSDPLFLIFTAVILAKVCKLEFASGWPVEAHPVLLKFKP